MCSIRDVAYIIALYVYTAGVTQSAVVSDDGAHAKSLPGLCRQIVLLQRPFVCVHIHKPHRNTF